MDNVNEFTRKFQSQYINGDEFELSPEADFREVGTWDSLTAMAVLVMVKEEYNVDIKTDDFRALVTVSDVYNYVTGACK